MANLIEVLSYRKGAACSYRPTPGAVCEISGPNCDNDQGYVYQQGEVLWTDATFIVWRVPGCWPIVNKWEHIRSRPLPPQPLSPPERFAGAFADSWVA